jgi:hypothetical protein
MMKCFIGFGWCSNERPMESVQPDMKLGNVTTLDRIILAYLAIADHEHYDACIKPAIAGGTEDHFRWVKVPLLKGLVPTINIQNERHHIPSIVS